MNEQTRFETEVRAYLHAQASGEAPIDLLSRGMSGVRHTPQRRSWLSRLSGSWILPTVGGAAVVAAAVLVAVLAGLLPPTPTPVGPSPSASPTTSATGSPSATPVVVPALPGFTTNAPTAPDATWTALTWRKLAADDPLGQVRKVIRWSGGFIALGQDQAAGDTSWTPVWTSSDGVTWTSLDPSVFGSGTIIYDVAQLPSGGLVALTAAGWADGLTTVPAQSWTSSDGRSWAAHPGPDVIAQSGLQSDERPVLATGPAGVIASSYRRPAAAAISPDGITWSALPETALPAGFAIGALAGTANGYLAAGAVAPAESPDGLTGIALTSPDGTHWSSVALPDPDAQGLPWGADGVLVGSQGFIAHGRLFAAPGAEVWWQSNDGQHWRLVPDYTPLGVSTAPVGRGADGMLVSDGSRILAVQFGGGAWESFDGQRWSRLAITGESPGYQGVLLPGGVLLIEPTTDGANAWIGEASAK